MARELGKPIDIGSLTLRQLWRFSAQIDRSGDCWLWTGSRRDSGYGVMHLKHVSTTRPNNANSVSAHRLAWALAHPEHAFKPRECVLHHCDNPPCVRPDHLFLGTQLDNARDLAAKGYRRFRKGSAHPNSRLTESQVHAIRVSDATHQDLAEQYGMRVGTIRKIKQRELWAHLEKRPRENPGRGNRKGHFRLTEKDVYDIRAASETQRVLAGRYGVCRSTISAIIRRETWAWLPEDDIEALFG